MVLLECPCLACEIDPRILSGAALNSLALSFNPRPTTNFRMQLSTCPFGSMDVLQEPVKVIPAMSSRR